MNPRLAKTRVMGFWLISRKKQNIIQMSNVLRLITTKNKRGRKKGGKGGKKGTGRVNNRVSFFFLAKHMQKHMSKLFALPELLRWSCKVVVFFLTGLPTVYARGYVLH